MSYRLNISKGEPVYINDEKEPSFFIDVNDIDFVDRAMKVQLKAAGLIKEMQTRSDKADKLKYPENVNAKHAIAGDTFDSISKLIDELFEEDLTKKLFKGYRSLDGLSGLIELIAKVIKEKRKSSVGDYLKPVKDDVMS